ncbi:MAG: glycosyltransferase family 2 protein [Candidatus Sulfobium sp.]|jgi:GT2 family glycosyltransferase
MPRPTISVVIVNLNGEKYLRDCLDSLSSQTFRDFEVIVVDNGSRDGSLDLINKEFGWVNVISLRENTGFARGNNVGIGASSGKYIATLNNDTIAESRWLEGLVQTAEADARTGMVASKILLGREGSELDSAGMLVYPDGMTRQRGRGQTDRGQFDKTEEVLFPSACAALYRREMLEETGFFDEDFFSYCEDADLGLRGRLAGWRAVMAPGAVVRHLYSQTGGKYSDFKAYHVERNRFWVLLKDLPLCYVFLFPFYTSWRYIIQVYSILSGRGSVARLAENSGRGRLLNVASRAFRDALGGIPRMLRKRRNIWRHRRIAAKDYRKILRRHRITAQELMLRE